ncbi:MAG: trigger factor [Rhodanobacteraceae bacterium]|nr:trigger factor [Rhodanobacteraceae bacterium]MBL0042114.1 trigger factor [Xanthomonadales bacterium]MBP6077614.1 trigger factor [Xanthomonadales bacterium]MBP7623980.1 trigger factor [Xanthomonadales bacterium]
MQVSVEQISTLERKMTVRVPAARYEERVRDRMRELGQNVRLKGFRPGKVPATVIEKRFGEQVRSEILGDVIGGSFQDAITQQKLRPAMSPRIARDNDAPKEELVYTATFDVMPEVGEVDVANLALTRLESKVEDADVERMIGTLRQQRRQWSPVERPAQAADMVVFEFSAQANDYRFPASGIERAGTVIGSGALFKEFEDTMLGLSAGDEKQARINFPAEFRDPGLAGKSADVQIKLVRVQEASLPEVDEAFAASFGIAGGLEKFRQDVRANLEREMRTTLNGRNKLHAVDTLVFNFKGFDLPQSRIEAETQALLAQTQEAAARNGRESEAPKEPTEQMRTVARNRVHASVLLEELSIRNQIRPTQQRVSEMLATIASTYEEPQKVIEMYLRDQQLMAGLRIRAMEDEVVDWVFEHAKVAPQFVSFQQLMQAPR